MGMSLYGFGLVGGLLNTYVFSQSSLRSNPCCLFLLALNIVDILHIHNSLLIRVLQVGFRWDPIAIFPFICQLRYYIGYVLITLYMIFLTFASCERYASTCNRQSQWRRFSKPKNVSYTILGCIIICCLVCLFIPFCYSVTHGSACTVQNSICTTLTAVYTLIVIGFVPPIFVTIFAWLTVRNLRIIRYRSRSAPISYKTYLRIKDANEQFTSMLFMQIVIMLISSIPYASLMIYQLSTRHINKSPVRIAWEQLISQSIHLLIYLNYVSSAYIYLGTSPMYRQHLISRNKQSSARVGIVHEFVSSIFASLSRAEDEKKVPLIPIHIAEVTEQKLQQHHHLTVAPLHMTSHTRMVQQQLHYDQCATNR
ncbi:unnamed protein product [Adineta steineri]|uniref:G-protein coupled receptors family 1 profile domain-containing protein n=2 Tax=Adineta steineri TaxID=433720 RepID=A0A815Q8M1_9BILA|nr:unnamed protein product [Adineta steineri]CAF3939007.1 unnamed protein product [Adineta steineri]